MRTVRKVRYSCDAKYIFSASDDHCVRVWKATADEPVRIMKGREKKAYIERKQLVNK
jgi:WD40 repeat protein